MTHLSLHDHADGEDGGSGAGGGGGGGVVGADGVAVHHVVVVVDFGQLCHYCRRHIPAKKGPRWLRGSVLD